MLRCLLWGYPSPTPRLQVVAVAVGPGVSSGRRGPVLSGHGLCGRQLRARAFANLAVKRLRVKIVHDVAQKREERVNVDSDLATLQSLRTFLYEHCRASIGLAFYCKL